MMTPAQLKAYEFKSAGRNAYKSEDVDAFFGEVAVNYEKMFRENSELIKRVSLLADKLEQYKTEEVDIKQVVVSAQKAANMIIKEAEDSVADSKSEAEAILAAAKGEAEIIKSDAEKQAIADSELALSLAKDKAEEIIAKAKEKAHGILIAANDSASDTMGAANRTITSESLHYDMLKKEVAEFRASILAQYKAHIEMISKLPEIAVEEASKIENVTLPEKSVEEIENYVDNGFSDVASTDSQEDSILEYVDDAEDIAEIDSFDSEDEFDAGEPVVKTELPFDFFEESQNFEFINDSEENEIDQIPSIEEFEQNLESALAADEDSETVDELSEEQENDEQEQETEAVAENVVESSVEKDVPVRKFSVDVSRIDYNTIENTEDNNVEGFSSSDEDKSLEDNNAAESATSFFDLFEKIDNVPDEDDQPSKRRGLFRKKK